MSIQEKENRWEIRSVQAPSNELQGITKERNLHPIITQLLAQRGLHDRRQIEEFLDPMLSTLPHPLAMGGMKEAAFLAGQAVLSGTPIVIWGDYDVDGATGTALLVSFFQQLGITAQFTIPNRMSHGYGLHSDLLQALAPTDVEKNKLLITVDCGISAKDEILAAQKMGFQVIVTDHHEPPEGVQVADAVLNPKQSTCSFPTQDLAGVGVAFYLACGIRHYLREQGFFHTKRPEPDVRELLDLVALGTIADMVVLGTVNRVLVKAGMRIIEQQKRPGIQAMLVVTGLVNSQKKLITAISSEDIGFLLAPMINAAGRLAEATLAVQLFLCFEQGQAMILSRQLLDLNDKRKKIGQEMYGQAIEKSLQTKKQSDCLIIKGEFHHGVIGIVASRLVEKYQLPVILFGRERDKQGRVVLKGSGRSVPGINLHKALEKCSALIIRYGGHAMSAGLSIYEDQFENFVVQMNREIGGQRGMNGPVASLEIDLEVDIDTLMCKHFCDQLQILEPFGPGNRRPLFITRMSQVDALKTVGNEGYHLKISFQGKKTLHQGIGFGLGSFLPQLQQKKNPIVAYTPMTNRYRDTLSWEVRVVGIMCAPEEKW